MNKIISEIIHCPITTQILYDPVMASDGQIYERSAIEEWFKTSDASPVTRNKINNRLYDAFFIKNVVEIYLKENPNQIANQYCVCKSHIKHIPQVNEIFESKKYELLTSYNKFELKSLNYNHLCEFIKNADHDIITYFIDNCYNLNVQISYNWFIFCVIEHAPSRTIAYTLSKSIKKNVLQKINNDVHTPLTYAIVYRDYDVVKILIQSKCKVVYNNNYDDNDDNDDNDSDYCGVEALHTAVIQNKLDIIQLLIENGALFDIKDGNKMCAIHYAIKHNHVHIVDYLLTNGVNLEITGPSGSTPLQLAAKYASVDIITKLLGHGCNKDVLTPYFNSLAGVAIMSNEITDSVKYLIDCCENYNHKNRDGNTLLHLTVLHDINLLEYILQKNIDICLQNNNGDTALHLLLNKNNTSETTITSNDIIECVDSYLASDYDFNTQNNNKNTVLNVALINNYDDVALYILNSIGNLNINCKNYDGNTLLHLAVIKNMIDVVKLLLQLPDIDVNIQNNLGNTPLHESTIVKNMEIMQLLLNSQCDLNTVNVDGYQALHTATSVNNTSAIELLINCGVDVNTLTSGSISCLQIAMSKGLSIMCKYLIEKNIILGV